jgi:phosphatidylglycerol:prolipoprotein diacylglycerol transferase
VRPRIVDFLNTWFGTGVFDWLVPDAATMYAVTMLVVLVVFVRRSKVSGLSQIHALGTTIWGMVGGLVGARVFWLLVHPDHWLSSPAVVFDVTGATASWGAYLGGVIGFTAYLLWRREPVLRYLDVVATVLGLGPFLGRWACFLNGDDFGRTSGVSWAVTFPHGSQPFTHHVRQGLLDPLADQSLAVHPVQLYLSLNGLLLFVVFTYLWKRYRFAPGTMFCLYWMAYAVSRFFIEFYRGSLPRTVLGVFNFPQLMTGIVFLAATLGLAAIHRTRGPLWAKTPPLR